MAEIMTKDGVREEQEFARNQQAAARKEDSITSIAHAVESMGGKYFEYLINKDKLEVERLALARHERDKRKRKHKRKRAQARKNGTQGANNHDDSSTSSSSSE